MVAHLRGRRTADFHPGDHVLVLDGPSWCRSHLVGQEGEVVRVLPFDNGDVWVKFVSPIAPWCGRMDAIEEFPFSAEQLVAL